MQEEILSKVIKNFNPQTVPRWDSLKLDTLDKGRAITNINFDAKIMGLCITHKNLDAAKSFVSYIYDKNEKPNVATLGKFMRLYHVCKSEERVSSKEEKVILNM